MADRIIASCYKDGKRLINKYNDLYVKPNGMRQIRKYAGQS
jgi:hypothetical protein